ncbi:hypothetical protein Nepgr_021057 [Nepenthes gracilis]|uniref:Uncharacterized protein n=1 Tax=Nepenthes gracilis TaxID=150966 RepID=A0AAD3XWZ8_NEPGR|nr:hypothetical protein Nepgr_021057 [Nepenthes gracilis]
MLVGLGRPVGSFVGVAFDDPRVSCLKDSVGSCAAVFADLLPSGILMSCWCCFQLLKMMLLVFNWGFLLPVKVGGLACLLSPADVVLPGASVAWATTPSDFGLAAVCFGSAGSFLGRLLSSDETGSGCIGRLHDDPV